MLSLHLSRAEHFAMRDGHKYGLSLSAGPQLRSMKLCRVKKAVIKVTRVKTRAHHKIACVGGGKREILKM